jgi:DNA anti-recombination protein RmuC/multisubunit Na+/H+ antiporter MnhG subunit
MMKKILLLPLLFMPCVSYAAATVTFSTITSDPITNGFVLVNLALTIFFAFIRFDRFAIVHGPEILTTVGILGCFAGIATSLLHFDSTNVAKSVPHLLEGVKTAFLASLSGVGGSLVIRARHYFQKKPIPQTPGTPKAASLDDVVAATQALQQSLAGNEDSSLLTQLKLMRQEQADELRLLRSSFDTFSAKMAEDGSKALIEALKEVINDFNAQINEQFGENFRHLNESVEKLVVWQQQYKEELDTLQAMQKSSAGDLKEASLGLASFISQASRFAQTADVLEKTLENMARQHQDIDQSQRSMSEVLSQMKEVTPQFSRKIDDMTTSMAQGVAKLQGDVSDIVKDFGTQAQSFSSEIKQFLTATLAQSQSEVNAGLTQSMDKIHQSVVALDTGLQEELTKSLETLGRQLASLSEKFVADYSPLTDRLREVVRLASAT